MVQVSEREQGREGAGGDPRGEAGPILYVAHGMGEFRIGSNGVSVFVRDCAGCCWRRGW